MDERDVSGVQGSSRKRKRKKEKRGPRIVERDGYWHTTGTIRIAGSSRRLRKTTGLLATGDNFEAADGILQKTIEDLKLEIIHGKKPPITWPQAAVGYLDERAAQRKAKRINGEDGNELYVRWFTLFLKSRGLHLESCDAIGADDIRDFLAERHFDQGHAGVTAKRTWDTVRAVFNYAKRKKRGNGAPDFDISKYINDRPVSTPIVGKWLYPEEIALLIECAPRHAKTLLAVLFNTGRRIGDLMWLSRRLPDYTSSNSTGLCLDRGDEHIYLGRTKNGKPRLVWLNDFAAEAIRDWLESRDDEFDELFLTDKLVPYKRPKKKRGGINRKAFNAARDDAAKIIEEEWNLPERAAIMRQITPHWARHNMTSHRLAAGEDKESVQKDLGWHRIEMVDRYGWDLPGEGKRRANIVQFGTKLTRQDSENREKGGKSNA